MVSQFVQYSGVPVCPVQSIPRPLPWVYLTAARVVTLEQGNTEQVSGFKASCHSKCSKSKAIHGVNRTRPLKDGSNLVPQSLETHIVTQAILPSPSLSWRQECLWGTPLIQSIGQPERGGREEGGREMVQQLENSSEEGEGTLYMKDASLLANAHTHTYIQRWPIHCMTVCVVYTTAWKWYQLAWWYAN